MTMRMLIALMAMTTAVPAMAQAPADNAGDPMLVTGVRVNHHGAKVEIEVAMAASAAGWNSGDVDRFLAIYSDDPATSFVGSSGVSRGKAGIRATYLKKYTGQFGADRDPAKMSKLSFTFDDFRMVGADHALLIARWTLVTGDGKTVTGMTSLLFRKEAGGWRIIADHSS